MNTAPCIHVPLSGLLSISHFVSRGGHRPAAVTTDSFPASLRCCLMMILQHLGASWIMQFQLSLVAATNSLPHATLGLTSYFLCML